jgi:hypothetical protein
MKAVAFIDYKLRFALQKALNRCILQQITFIEFIGITDSLLRANFFKGLLEDELSDHIHHGGCALNELGWCVHTQPTAAACAQTSGLGQPFQGDYRTSRQPLAFLSYPW